MQSEKFQHQVLTTLETLQKDVGTIHKEMHELKMNLEDSTLTESERQSLEETDRDLKEGKLLSSEDVKKRLGL